jgi:hypothetical protein
MKQPKSCRLLVGVLVGVIFLTVVLGHALVEAAQ